MSQAPPPMFVPPSPYQPRNRVSPASIVVLAILCVFLFALVCTGLVYIGIKFGRAHPRSGWNRAIVGEPISKGWQRYHIPALELSIASFVKPVPPSTMGKAVAGRADVAEYVEYSMRNKALSVLVDGHWMRGPLASLSRIGDYQKKQFELRHPDFTRSSEYTTVVDSNEARLITIEYPYKHYDEVSKMAVVVRGNARYYFQGSYWKSPSGWADKSFDYMLRSIRFDKPSP